ncbi:hypothetical protein Taro_052253, partial [Colocasia esculenta]|nr:hypothetical protein [Colocasia esculenta]
RSMQAGERDGSALGGEEGSPEEVRATFPEAGQEEGSVLVTSASSGSFESVGCAARSASPSSGSNNNASDGETRKASSPSSSLAAESGVEAEELEVTLSMHTPVGETGVPVLEEDLVRSDSEPGPSTPGPYSTPTTTTCGLRRVHARPGSGNADPGTDSGDTAGSAAGSGLGSSSRSLGAWPWWSRLVAFDHRTLDEALSAACRQESEMDQYLEEKKATQKRSAPPFQRHDRKKAVYQSPQRLVAASSQ